MARSLSRALGLDEDLAEALALAHDLGHPPFGHAGETALDECLKGVGGFDHNVQTLRVVTALERRYPDYDGLNLTWETIEGLIKHNGPLTDREGEPTARYRARGIAEPLRRLAEARGIDLALQGSAEAQVAAISDDIAYNAHDIDDGLRADLFAVDDLRAVPLLAGILDEIDCQHPGLDPARRGYELVRRLIARFIADVTRESARRAAQAELRSPDDVRRLPQSLVAFSAEVAEAERAIKAFLFPRMYRHPHVLRVTGEAKDVVRDLFRQFVAHPETMPEGWREGPLAVDQALRARRVGDFIAGMTDGFALAEHARFFDTTPELR
jgi:dGTPase